MKHTLYVPINRWATPAIMTLALAACGVPTENSSSSQAVSSASSWSSAPASSSKASSSSSAPSSNLSLVMAINAGSTTKTTFEGVEYQVDKFSRGGTTNSTSDPISGTAEGTLFQTERYGSYSYQIPVTEASYTVELHFVEMYNTSAGDRSFSVKVEGKSDSSLTNMDIYSLAGHDGAYSYTIENVAVSDNVLSIELESIVDNATLSGFAIYSATGKYDENYKPPTPEGSLPSTFGLSVGHSKFLGNIWNGSDVGNASRIESFTKLWNQVTLENAGKWNAVEPSRDQMNFGPVTAAYNWAQDTGGYYRHHVFVWGSQEPGWVGSLSRADQRAEVEELIKETCTRFPNMHMIDVVNEALTGQAPSSYREALGGGQDGSWAWIVQSFKWARQYCPNSLLGLNAYNIVNSSSNIRTYNGIVDILKRENLIDTVGVQYHHFSVNSMNASSTKSALDQLAVSGLPLVIEEFDAENSNAVAKYRDIFPAMWEHEAVIGVTIWGQRKNETWRQQHSMGVLNSSGGDAGEMTFLREYFKNSPLF